jgi:hypothetical protein
MTNSKDGYLLIIYPINNAIITVNQFYETVVINLRDYPAYFRKK